MSNVPRKPSRRERRRAKRQYPKRVHANLHLASIVCVVRLLDESPLGMGVYVPQPVDLQPGESVTISISGSLPRPATVCHVNPHPMGGTLLGIRWIKDASTG